MFKWGNDNDKEENEDDDKPWWSRPKPTATPFKWGNDEDDKSWWNKPKPTPTAIPAFSTPLPTRSPTQSPSPTPTRSPTPTPSITPAPTQSATPAPTQSPFPTPSLSPAPTPSFSPAPTPSFSPQPTQTFPPTKTSVPSSESKTDSVHQNFKPTDIHDPKDDEKTLLNKNSINQKKPVGLSQTEVIILVCLFGVSIVVLILGGIIYFATSPINFGNRDEEALLNLGFY